MLHTSCTKEKTTHIIIKVPPQMLKAYGHDDVKELYQFMEKAASEFVEHYDKKLTYEVVCFPYTDEDLYITDCFDTNDSCDVLLEGNFNMASYIYTGRVVPLDDIISEDLRQDIDKSLWDLSTVNGKTYILPFYTLQNVLAFNKDLFRQAGLAKYADKNGIQSWSLSQWDEILSALKNNIAPNCYVLPMYAKNEQGDTHIMTSIRRYGCNFFDKEGFVHISDKEGIKALAWLRNCKDMGLYPPNAQMMELLDMHNLFLAKRLAFYPVNITSIKTFKDIDLGYVNFAYVDGALTTSFVMGFEVFDNNDMARLEAAKAFVKYIYESPFVEYALEGLPAIKSITEKYEDKIPMLKDYETNSHYVWDNTGGNPAWRQVRGVFWTHIRDLLDGTQSPKQVAAQIETDCNSILKQARAVAILHD